MATADMPLAAAAPEAAPSPAPESAPVASPEVATPAAEPIAMNDGESSGSFFERALKTKTEGQSSPEQPPAKPEEPKPIEGEVKPVEQPPEAAPEEKPEGEEEDQPSLEPQELVGTRDLASKLKANPAAEKALKDAGIDVNSLYATARVASKGAKVLEVFGDLETATYAREQAEEFGKLSGMLTSATSIEDTHKLLGEMWKYSYVLDEEGKPVMDANGQPTDDGTIGRFLGNVNQIANDYYLQQVNAGNPPPQAAVDMVLAWAAKHTDDPDLAAAAEIFEGKYKEQSGGAPAPDYTALDAQTRARLEAADAREKEVATREAAEQTRKEQEFELNVAKGIDSKLDESIAGLFKNSALTDGQKKWALDQVKERVIDKLKASTIFYNKRDALARRPMSEKTANARVAHGLNSARPLFVPVAREVLAELGVQIGAQREAGTQKLATQVAASRSEVRSGSQPAKPQTHNSADLYKMAQDEARKDSGGREPSTASIMGKLAEIKARYR